MNKVKVGSHDAAMAIIRDIPNLKTVEIKYSEVTGQWTVKYQQYTHRYVKERGGK
jgi:hypothetical protein